MSNILLVFCTILAGFLDWGLDCPRPSADGGGEPRTNAVSFSWALSSRCDVKLLLPFDARPYHRGVSRARGKPPSCTPFEAYFLDILSRLFACTLVLTAPSVRTHVLEYSLVVASVVSLGHLSTTALAASTLGSMTASVSGYSIIQGFASTLDTMLPSAWTSTQPQLVGLWSQRMGAYRACRTLVDITHPSPMSSCCNGRMLGGAFGLITMNFDSA